MHRRTPHGCSDDFDIDRGALSSLQACYATQWDGGREHQYGVDAGALENPLARSVMPGPAEQHERDLYVIDENERHQVDTVSVPLYRLGEAPEMCTIYSLMGHAVRDGDAVKVTNVWPLRQEVLWDYQNNADFGIPVQTEIAEEKQAAGGCGCSARVACLSRSIGMMPSRRPATCWCARRVSPP